MTNVLLNPERLRLLGIASHVFDITPGSSALPVAATMGLYIGGAGDVEITSPGGNTVVLEGVAAGTILPIAATHVLSANTTATAIVGLA